MYNAIYFEYSLFLLLSIEIKNQDIDVLNKQHFNHNESINWIKSAL
jgi:hypothetical protein